MISWCDVPERIADGASWCRTPASPWAREKRIKMSRRRRPRVHLLLAALLKLHHPGLAGRRLGVASILARVLRKQQQQQPQARDRSQPVEFAGRSIKTARRLAEENLK